MGNLDNNFFGKLIGSDEGKCLCISDGEIDGFSETWIRRSSIGL